VTILNIGNQASQTMPATSGTYNFSVVRDDIIRDTMLNLGILEESEVPTAREITDCARKLSMIVKQLAGNMDKAPGFKMWQRERGDLFLSQSQYAYDLGPLSQDAWAGGVTGLRAPITFQSSNTTASAAIAATVISLSSLAAVNINDYVGFLINGSKWYWTTISGLNQGASTITIPAPGLPTAAGSGTEVVNYTVKAQRPVEILTSSLRDSNTVDTPMTRMSLEVYEALPTKVQPGNLADPTAFYYEPRVQNNQGRYYIDCAGAQDPTKYQHVVYLRQSQDFDNPGDAPEFPQEWFNHLSWSLTLACHAMFEVDWTQGMQAAYSTATMPAREANAATTETYFQPDDEDNN
jgi:hypothetical protein